MPNMYDAPILCLDGVTTTAAGPSLGLQGNIMAYGSKEKQLMHLPLHFWITLSDTVAGATGTVVIESSPLGASSWTALYTYAFSALAGLKKTQDFGITLKDVYVRARVSAIAGTAPAMNGYLKRGSNY